MVYKNIIVIYSYRRSYINFYRINHAADEGGAERGRAREEEERMGEGRSLRRVFFSEN